MLLDDYRSCGTVSHTYATTAAEPGVDIRWLIVIDPAQGLKPAGLLGQTFPAVSA